MSVEYRRLGRVDLDVPAVGMGTWRAFDARDRAGLAACRDLALASLAAGADLFDASPMYGNAEYALAQAIRDRRDGALVATKVWTTEDKLAEQQMARALGWYQGRVDVYQVHNLVAWERRLPELEALKAAGRALAIGATHVAHGAFPELMEAMRTERLDVVQVPYNPVDRTVERDVLPLADRLGLGVIVTRPLAEGALAAPPAGFDPARYEPYGVATWPQVVLKWILSDARVACVVPATSSPAHARENAAAGEPPWFETSERDRIARLAA